MQTCELSVVKTSQEHPALPLEVEKPVFQEKKDPQTTPVCFNLTFSQGFIKECMECQITRFLLLVNNL